MEAITEQLGPTTYARVDVFGADGQARVLEVELVPARRVDLPSRSRSASDAPGRTPGGVAAVARNDLVKRGGPFRDR